MKSQKPLFACPLFPRLLDPPASTQAPPAIPQISPSLQGAGAGEFSSAFFLGTRQVRFVEGRVDPECTPKTRRGLGEYTDVIAMSVCRSAFSSRPALPPLPGYPYLFPFMELLGKHLFPKPHLPFPSGARVLAA